MDEGDGVERKAHLFRCSSASQSNSHNERNRDELRQTDIVTIESNLETVSRSINLSAVPFFINQKKKSSWKFY